MRLKIGSTYQKAVTMILLYEKSIASSPVHLRSCTIDAQSSNLILRSCAFLSFHVAIVHLPKKNVDFPPPHQNYILNLSSSAHRSHGLFACKKKKENTL